LWIPAMAVSRARSRPCLSIKSRVTILVIVVYHLDGTQRNDSVVYISVMEIAKRENISIRPAEAADKGLINKLLRRAPYCHLHADWRLPGDWVGWPEFLLCESDVPGGELVGCLAATADPPPAAWVRIAAANSGFDPIQLFGLMFERVLPSLSKAGVDQLGWLLAQPWPESWVRSLGFQQVNAITTYTLGHSTAWPSTNQRVVIRPVESGDMETLAEIEAAAFEPLWRHSAAGLFLALQQATEFEVALLDGELAGFLYSVPGGYKHGHEHLARITVSPRVQGLGVGRALLASALSGYKKRNVSHVSLNTQLDNLASHRLYKSFGFRPVGDEIPVWAIRVK
jgi:ribosomal protein S18 acetylase RimI-like enzyme